MIAAGSDRDFDQWRAQLTTMSEHARRSQASRLVQLNRLCREAGLGGYDGCAFHNAFVGLEHGHPWRGVDYSILRRARRLERHLCEASRIVTRWYRRTYWEAVCPACRVEQPCAFHAGRDRS